MTSLTLPRKSSFNGLSARRLVRGSDVLKTMGDHALVNVICSGNKVWAELASKEYQWRLKNKKHIIK